MQRIIFSLLLLFSCYRPGQIVFTCSMDQFEQVRKHTEFCTNVIRMEEPTPRNFKELFVYLDRKFLGQVHNPNTENNVKAVLRNFCHEQYCCGKINEEFRNELEEFLVTRIQIK